MYYRQGNKRVKNDGGPVNAERHAAFEHFDIAKHFIIPTETPYV